MNATPMISVDENMGGPTSAAAAAIRSRTEPRAARSRWRNRFSIMITVESTTMPKSTAPSEIRFAGVPVATIPMKAPSSASGMLRAVISAARACPRNRYSTTVTSPRPISRFSRTVWVVTATRRERS